MWLVDTFDEFSQYLQMFENAKIIGNYEELVFKKTSNPLSVRYGLFDKKELVAYYWLIKFSSQFDLMQSFEVRVRDDYQRKGIAYFFYKHILLDEKIWIVSDYSHNVTSGIIWDKLQQEPMIKVGIYNRLLDSIEFSNSISKHIIYKNDHMHYIASARE